MGRRVLVTGCGPIGALCVAVARFGGAAEIVATDIASEPLRIAGSARRHASRQRRLRPRTLWRPTRRTRARSTSCSRPPATQAALRGALDAVRPGGVIVQVGLGGDMTLPINVIVAKELQLRGTFRFDERVPACASS